jgi:CRISPR type III-B/RAMP module-associated protein Cmr3
MSTASWLALRPRDTVFVRDGRSFDAASDALAQTVRPSPTTIAGAVGQAFGQNPDEVRGPVLAREGPLGWQPHFPAPADLVVTAGESRRVFRLAPDQPSGQTDLDEVVVRDGPTFRWLMPPTHVGPVEPLRGWIPGDVLADYLAGRLPAPGGTPESGFAATEPLCPEPRVGLARDGRNARSGYLYQATHLRPREGWAFLAELTVPDEWHAEPSNHVPFGGRGRLADVGAANMSWPDAATAIGKRVLVYLATPAIWPGGWQIPVPDGAELVAAATGEAEPVATVKPGPQWRDSRALRWAVPAGSVYLLEFGDAGAAAAWAREQHGTAYGRGQKDPLRTAGFGVVLTGAWT